MKKLSIPIAIILILAFLLSGCTGVGVASSWPGILVDNETIYTAYGPGVYAVNATNGSMIWRYPAKAGRVSYFATPTLTADGQLLVGDFSNDLSSLDAKTGTLRWTFKANGRWIAQPVVDNETIFAANGDRNLYALNTNGVLVWKFQTGGLLWSSPLVMDNVVYLAGMDHFVYAIDETSGKQIWKTDAGGAIIGNPVNADGTIYVGTMANEVVEIKVADGSILGRFPADGAVWSGPSIKDGKFYFGDLNGTFYAVDGSNRQQLWQYKASGAILDKPLLTDSQVIFTTEDGYVLALDYTGKVIYNKKLTDKLYGTPVVSGNNFIVGTTVKENILLALDANANQVWLFAQPK